jgi:hypothetical protein
VPLALAVIAAWGLIAALLTEGPADFLWSSLAAVPLAAIAFGLMRR